MKLVCANRFRYILWFIPQFTMFELLQQLKVLMGRLMIAKFLFREIWLVVPNCFRYFKLFALNLPCNFPERELMRPYEVIRVD